VSVSELVTTTLGGVGVDEWQTLILVCKTSPDRGTILRFGTPVIPHNANGVVAEGGCVEVLYADVPEEDGGCELVVGYTYLRRW
jgi:hypothetical protein